MIREECFINNYQQGIKALQDLHLLGDSDLVPLLNQLHYHLYKVKEDRKDDSHLLSTYQKLECFLQENISEIIRSFFIKKEKVNQLNFEKKVDGMTLEKWNRLIEVLPATLATVEILDCRGMIDIKLNEENLIITSDICNDQSFEEKRQIIYSQQRKIIKNRSLMTFNLGHSEMCGFSRLSLIVDISHTGHLAYCINIKQEQGMVLGVSNIFEHYKIDEDTRLGMIKKLKKCICIEITDQLGLIRHDKVPDFFESVKCKKEILYFNFLFRPLSIIIPDRGRIFPIGDIQSLGDTGSGNVITIKQEFEKFFQYRFRYLDFFSLMCE